MSDTNTPRLNKWPFLIGDLLLVLAAAWITFHSGPPFTLWNDVLVVLCMGVAACIGFYPFLVEYKAMLKVDEMQNLGAAIEQIKKLEEVGQKMDAATSKWQTVHESADKTSRIAREMVDQISAESRAFSEAMKQAHDAEVRTLRLEVDKMRRGEGEWLQVLVRIMDHVHALYAAAAESGNPEIASQLGRFQAACREVARRVGLAPLDVPSGVDFDERLHELPDGKPASPGSKIQRMLVTGFTFQGQLIRRAMVLVRPGESSGEDAPAADAPAAQK